MLTSCSATIESGRADSGRLEGPTGSSTGRTSRSITCRDTTVTLSGAPRSNVIAIRVSAISDRSSVERITCSISARDTTASKPSEESTQRSPGTASRVFNSSSGEASTSPRTRIITFLCGWFSASCGVIRPSLSRRCTNVWSVEICSNSPSAPGRRRYARESPIWANSMQSPSISRAVQVVPIPANCGSFAASSLIIRFAL